MDHKLKIIIEDFLQHGPKVNKLIEDKVCIQYLPDEARKCDLTVARYKYIVQFKILSI